MYFTTPEASIASRQALAFEPKNLKKGQKLQTEDGNSIFLFAVKYNTM